MVEVLPPSSFPQTFPGRFLSGVEEFFNSKAIDKTQDTFDVVSTLFSLLQEGAALVDRSSEEDSLLGRISASCAFFAEEYDLKGELFSSFYFVFSIVPMIEALEVCLVTSWNWTCRCFKDSEETLSAIPLLYRKLLPLFQEIDEGRVRQYKVLPLDYFLLGERVSGHMSSRQEGPPLIPTVDEEKESEEILNMGVVRGDVEAEPRAEEANVPVITAPNGEDACITLLHLSLKVAKCAKAFLGMLPLFYSFVPVEVERSVSLVKGVLSLYTQGEGVLSLYAKNQALDVYDQKTLELVALRRLHNPLSSTTEQQEQISREQALEHTLNRLDAMLGEEKKDGAALSAKMVEKICYIALTLLKIGVDLALLSAAHVIRGASLVLSGVAVGSRIAIYLLSDGTSTDEEIGETDL